MKHVPPPALAPAHEHSSGQRGSAADTVNQGEASLLNGGPILSTAGRRRAKCKLKYFLLIIIVCDVDLKGGQHDVHDGECRFSPRKYA